MKNFKKLQRMASVMAAVLAVIPSCTKPVPPCMEERMQTGDGRTETTLDFTLPAPLAGNGTKGSLSDEDNIWDMNIWIFDSHGSLCLKEFMRYPSGQGGGVSFKYRLMQGVRYTVYAAANCGYEPYLKLQDRLLEWKFFLSVPEGGIRGIPMSRAYTLMISEEGERHSEELERLMSKVSVSLDRKDLSPDVRMVLTRSRISNCPRSAGVFFRSGAGSADDCFREGYTGNDPERVELYLCENITQDKDMLSYVEMFFDYESTKYKSTGEGLVYRFYIGEEDGSGVKRNSHYRYKVMLRGDGLGNSSDNWRVDRSNLVSK